jgi:hypothetical protein
MTFGPPSSLGSYEDCSFSGLSYDALQHYYSDSEADSYVRQRTRLFKPVPAATSRLQDPHLKCDRNLGWSIDWAVAFIVDHLNKKTDAAESLRGIRIKAAQLERDGSAQIHPTASLTSSMRLFSLAISRTQSISRATISVLMSLAQRIHRTGVQWRMLSASPSS